MAAVTSCNYCLPNFTTDCPLPRRKPLQVFCVISTSTPRKFTIRKNYLRQKLLKTLTKPCPSSPTSEPTRNDPLIPIETQSEEGLDLLENEQSREADFKEFSSDASLDGSLGKFPKVPVLQYAMWLFGAFVLYGIVIALDVGSFEFENRKHAKKERKNGVLEVGLNGKGQTPAMSMRNDKMVLENAGVVYLDEGEMLKKIDEIQMMAREARAKERLEGKRDGYESDEEAGIDSSKSGIEKEVIDRLVKLSKKLEKKLPVESMDNLKKDVVNGRNNLSREKSNETLMFKKKYRFRGLSSRQSDKPKGFTGRFDDTTNKDPTSNPEDGGSEAMINGDTDKDGVLDLFDNMLEVEVKDGDSGAVLSTYSEDDGSRKQALEATRFSRTAGNKLIGVSDEKDEMKKASNLKSIKIELKHSGSKIGRMKSETEIEPWWSSLRYVLVILMQGEHDGPLTGLFTLRNSSSAKSSLSHTVAFEDRGDATNFCYLVQSFFEDLEGFSAEIAPLPTKELIERVKSQTMKVIVVKKGQLKLYAGQPLQDAEMALRSLVDQS